MGTTTLGIPTPQLSAADVALRLAQQRIGILASAQRVFTDCDSQGGFDFPAGGSGSTTIDTTNGGGFWNYTTGASGFTNARMIGTPAALAHTLGKKWHLVVRMKVTSTPDVLSEGRAGTFGNYVGVLSSSSTTKYIGKVSTTVLVSTVSIDVAFHQLELWSNGANVFLSVDGETPVSAANIVPGTAYPFVQFNNNSTGAVVTGVTDWMHFYSERDL